MTTKRIPRVVLDTNVFVSSLLFEGISKSLVSFWQKSRLLYLITRPILDEYLRVLAYPKFHLTEKEVKFLIEEELLPYVEVVKENQEKVPSLKDKDDEKFLIAALSGKAEFLLTGDKELLALKRIKTCDIVSPGQFLDGTIQKYSAGES